MQFQKGQSGNPAGWLRGSRAVFFCGIPCYFPVPACYFRQILCFRIDFLADLHFTPPFTGIYRRV